MPRAAVESRPLPAGADAEVEKLVPWMRSDEANFHTFGSVRICQNLDGLSSETSDLVALLWDEIKTGDSQANPRVTAFYFEETMTIPAGTVEVGGLRHTPNSYFRLKAKTQVSGNFLGLLLTHHA
ncbi:hypothetical protein GQX73_g9622 [Xylaria multiplex]|uniref:Uncharacterized protein n=1 Tax=Xylaria multiplex TaxID=323545 RepID=A0A7C8IHP0_9PEZI|nr:hypothetical protein GQX73_g9622 [Xylaria multiplex]